MLEVTEINSDLQSVRYKWNQTDLNIINNYFQIGASLIKCEFQLKKWTYNEWMVS